MNHDYYVLFRLLATFVRSEPRFCEVPVDEPVPWLEEVDITFMEEKSEETRERFDVRRHRPFAALYMSALFGPVKKLSIRFRGENGEIEDEGSSDLFNLAPRIGYVDVAVNLMKEDSILADWEITLYAAMVRCGTYDETRAITICHREKSSLEGGRQAMLKYKEKCFQWSEE